MADRYWVGGTAAWDGTAGTKWSATSGGPGGASVPTTADDVFFNASSTGTVTVSTGNTGAKSINCTGFTGTIAGTAAISIAGSVTLVAGMSYTHTGTATFTGTGTLITAGKTFSAVTVDGVGITLTLGDALNISTRTLTITNGTFDTGNYNVTAGSVSSSNTNTRTITLGSSTLTLNNNIGFSTSTNLTLNSGTSQITLTGNAASFNGGSLTFYNVSFTGTGVVAIRQITGVNTFNNLSITPPTAGLIVFDIFDNQTVSGTLTCAGSSAIARLHLRSDILGTTRTLTVNSLSANDCDFRDITLAGAAAGTSPTRAGDCGGNSGITFPAPKTVYRVGTNTTWSGSTSWALTSGGGGSNNNYPLPQDTAIINNDTALTGTLSLSGRINAGTLDASARTTGITINFGSTLVVYGSFVLGSGVTVTGTATCTFAGRGTTDFTSAGKTITFSVTVQTFGGTFRLLDAFTCSADVTLDNGTFNANNYNFTARTFNSNGALVRTITMGSGTWTISGTGVIWDISSTNLTLNKDTANILLSNTTTTARTINVSTFSYNKLTIGGTTGISTLIINGAASFTELASTKTVAHTIRLNTDLGTVDTWSVTGTAGNVVTFNSNSAGTRRNFTLTNITADINYLSVTDIGELSGNKFYVGVNSTDGGNNSNVYFSAPARILNVDAGVFTLTGNPATLTKAKKLEAGVGIFNLTGNPATLTKAKKLEAVTGVFTLTGNPVTFIETEELNADVGTFILTEQNVNLSKQYKIISETGVFNLVGNNATLTKQSKLNITTGSFQLTGNSAFLTKGLKIDCTVGSFILTGQNATFLRQYLVSTETGIFNLTGNNAALIKQTKLNPVTGNFQLTRYAAGLFKGTKLTTLTGAFTLTGNAAQLVKNTNFNTDTGLFTFTGNDVSFERAYVITSTVGVFTLVGNTSALSKGLVFQTQTGLFTLTLPPVTTAYTPRKKVVFVF